MNYRNEIYDKFEDENGEEYFCSMDVVADNRIVSEWEIESCVEVSTAERYSGNLNIAGRD